MSVLSVKKVCIFSVHLTILIILNPGLPMIFMNFKHYRKTNYNNYENPCSFLRIPRTFSRCATILGKYVPEGRHSICLASRNTRRAKTCVKYLHLNAPPAFLDYEFIHHKDLK